MNRPPKSKRAVFNAAADRTIKVVTATYAQRGAEYADSWHVDNLITTFVDVTLRRFGIDLTPEEKRLLIAAALVDVKDSRLVGGFKADSVVDGIAYRALFAALFEDYEARNSR